jgi:hypothetical protein
MWVVWDKDTGYSDESMRFAEREEACDYMLDNEGNFAMRYEP